MDEDVDVIKEQELADDGREKGQEEEVGEEKEEEEEEVGGEEIEELVDDLERARSVG